MASELKFSELKLWQATFEVRYDDAYILWDRAGLIWSKVREQWPGLKSAKVEPNMTTFILNDRFELTIKLDRAYLIDLKATSSLKDFIDFSRIFINIVSKYLEISTFGRVALRVLYNKRFPDKIAAANAVIATKLMSVLQGKHFNIEGKVLFPRYSLIWEGELTGMRVILAAQERKVELEVTPGIEELSSVKAINNEVIFDIDYYSIRPISKGQLEIKEWITEAYHVIRRDIAVFMEK